MSDEWCPEHDGSHCAELRRLEQRIARLEAPERAILPDLIKELRELATCDIDLGNQTDPETLAFLLDRAEARLREVTGDE